MLIVVEGPSAAGKTTWCQRFAAGRTLREGEPDEGDEIDGASDPNPADPQGIAEFWVGRNARRWSLAHAMAAQLGWVVCDTDPFKLHWAWSLWKSGVAARAYWDACKAAGREAFASGILGLPDLVLFADVDPVTLRLQRLGDHSRLRRRHDLHIRIAPALKRWYTAMARLDPTRVHFSLPPAGLTPELLDLGPRAARSGTPVFDGFMEELERID